NRAGPGLPGRIWHGGAEAGGASAGPVRFARSIAPQPRDRRAVESVLPASAPMTGESAADVFAAMLAGAAETGRATIVDAVAGMDGVMAVVVEPYGGTAEGGRPSAFAHAVVTQELAIGRQGQRRRRNRQ